MAGTSQYTHRMVLLQHLHGNMVYTSNIISFSPFCPGCWCSNCSTMRHLFATCNQLRTNSAPADNITAATSKQLHHDYDLDYC